MKPYVEDLRAANRLFDVEVIFTYTMAVASPFVKNKRIKLRGEHAEVFTDKDALLRFVIDKFNNGHDMVATPPRGWERWQR